MKFSQISKYYVFGMLLFNMLSTLADGGPLARKPEESRTLVEHTVEAIPFTQLGYVSTRTAKEISQSSWSIGCEVLDRNFAEYAKYKDYVGPLGAKAGRLQGGWAKTEKQPGIYDWAWLDFAIDHMISNGMRPWVQLSYGNPLYKGGGGININDAGPTSSEAKAAWDKWTRALVRRYKDRVSEWEIWNEPDISRKMSLEQYSELFVKTAEIIRQEQPDSRIYALSLAHVTRFADDFLRGIERLGKLDLIDAITFHAYPHNPDEMGTLFELQALVAKYPRKIQLREGETGAPSAKTSGALRYHEWTEIKQAKWNLRRMLAFHGHEVPFNLFTISEFSYRQGLNAKGLLQVNETLEVVKRKPAYFAAQHVFSIFDDALVRADIVDSIGHIDEPVAKYGYEVKKSGRGAVAFWLSGEPPRDSSRYREIILTLKGVSFHDPVYVDLLTGIVFEIPKDRISEKNGQWKFIRIPVADSPVLIINKQDLAYILSK